jgi:RNA polymerase sigma factor (sigma-70 family)
MAGRDPARRSRPLSSAREHRLLASSEAGDRDATAELVDAFMPAIDGVAYLYRGLPGLDRMELRQEGVVGLLRAARRYDQSFHTPFWSYASWWVRQAMQQLVSELTGPVVLSDRAARQLVQIKRARLAYQQLHQHEPSTGELAEAADLPREQVESLIAVERAPRGLEERFPGDDETSSAFSDRLADPASGDTYERVGNHVSGELIPDLTAGLEERERHILFAHYGIKCRPRTLREIGTELNLSVERVRQLEERALQKLREIAAWP